MRILENPILRELTTLRLGGCAIALVDVEQDQDYDQLPLTLARLGGHPISLGRGSNVLAEDGNLPLVLVRAVCKSEPEVLCRDEKQVLIRVSAGQSLPRLLAWAAENSLSGLEGLAGIPGQVGGSVAMNAGSYGTEIGRCLHALRVFSPSTGLVRLRGGFEPQYRKMLLPGLGAADNGWKLIRDVELALTSAREAEIRAKMAKILERKRSTQPLSASSAGCVFRNPEGLSAGKLIDEAGLRGKRLGGMAFSELHANFLINHGQGTSEQAFALMSLAVQTVGERFGVILQREVKVWLSC